MSDRTEREQQARILEDVARCGYVNSTWQEAALAGASALRADPSSGRREELNLIRARIQDWDLGLGPAYKSVRDLLDTRLAQLPTEGK